MKTCRDCINFTMTDVHSGNGMCTALPPESQTFMVPGMKKVGDQQVPSFEFQHLSVERQVHKGRQACQVYFIARTAYNIGPAE